MVFYKIVYHKMKKIFKMNQNVFERGVKVKSGSSLGNIKELIEPTSYEIVLKVARVFVKKCVESTKE
jgi:hypothetical protein